MKPKKKKKKNPAPKKTLKRPQRLLRAKAWLAAYPVNPYTDQKIVHAYAKKYRTGLAVAIFELRLLGVPISTVYEEAVKKAQAEQAEQRRRQKEAKLNAHLAGIEQDDYFAFIVGYTSGGAPYGLTWAELTEEEKEFYRYKIPRDDDANARTDF
jgi:hypothetical protein